MSDAYPSGSAAQRSRLSAALLPVWFGADGTEVFIGRMGGPFWARRERAWSVIKGEVCAGEPPEETARREWAEETGTPAPEGDWHDLGEVRQSGGKRVRGFAVVVADPAAVQFVSSTTVVIQWPPRSRRELEIPEIERAEWVSLDVAREQLVAAQTGFLDRVVPLGDIRPG